MDGWMDRTDDNLHYEIISCSSLSSKPDETHSNGSLSKRSAENRQLIFCHLIDWLTPQLLLYGGMDWWWCRWEGLPWVNRYKSIHFSDMHMTNAIDCMYLQCSVSSLRPEWNPVRSKFLILGWTLFVAIFFCRLHFFGTQSGKTWWICHRYRSCVGSTCSSMYKVTWGWNWPWLTVFWAKF